MMTMNNNVAEIQRFRVNRNAWKSNLIKEIVDLEDGLDQLFNIAGIKPHRVVSVEDSEIDESTIVTNNKRPANGQIPIKKQEATGYETIIDEHFKDISRASDNICALITSVTEFDLPIPVHVLLRLASRLSSLKWVDHKRKIPGSISRKYVYSKSGELVQASLKLFKWISIVLETNILPFQPFINHNIFSILEWTRTSVLLEHDQVVYYELRSHTLEILTSMIGTLSTNLGLEPVQLKNLIEVEIIESLNKCLFDHDNKMKPINSVQPAMTKGASVPSNGHHQQQPHINSQASSLIIPKDSAHELKDSYAEKSLVCLERLFIMYSNFLDAPLEQKLKTFVIQNSIKIYRDFERNVIGLAIRRQLMRLVEVLANRPYATSTTELAWHLFELADRMESDAEIKLIARRSIKVGLAHRPTIVSNYGVYSAYAGKLIPLTNGLIPSSGVNDDEHSSLSAEDLSQPVECDHQHEMIVDVQSQLQLLPQRHPDEQQEQRQLQLQVQVQVQVQVQDEVQNSEDQPVVSETTNSVVVEGERDECEKKATKKDKQEQAKNEKDRAIEHDNVTEAIKVISQGKTKVSEIEKEDESKKSQVEEEQQQQELEERPEDDPQVQSFMSLFVDKPAN